MELKATTAGFKASFDDASKTVKNFSDQSTTGLQKLQSVGGVAFAAVGASALAFGTMAVKAALDGEQAHAQLVQAVQNSGTAFDSVSGQVDNMSERFAKLGYENDQVEEALGRLIGLTGNVSGSIANMNVVADVARARNLSLADAATLVGKAMNGNVTAMSRLGIQTKDAAGNTITAAQAVELLNQRFGGTAQAEAGTYAGKLQALNAEYNNTKEKIGDELLPVLASLAGGMAETVGWFDRHRAVAETLAGVIGGPLVVAMTLYAARQAQAFAASVAQAVSNVVKAVTSLVPAAEAAGAAESGLATTTALATGGLSLLTAGVTLVAAHFLSHSAAANDTATAMVGAAGAAGDLTGAEGDLGDTTDTTNSAIQAQSTLLKQLTGDSNAQQSELLKLIGDQNSLDSATQKLKSSTGANSEVTKQATQHAKDLKDANDQLTQATKAVSDALDKQSAAKKKLDDLMAPQSQRNITDAADAHTAANDRLGRAQLAVTDKTKDLNDAIAQYGAGSEQATLAQYDLNDALREVDSAQEAVDDTMQTLSDTQRQTIGTTDQITQATSDLTDATQAVTDAQGKQTTAQNTLNTVLANRDAIAAAATDTQNLASNTLAWQQATAQLNSDWSTLNGALAADPDLRNQLVTQITDLKNNLPKGADVQPLLDLLTKIQGTTPTVIGWQALPPGTAGPPSPIMGPAGTPASQVILWQQLPPGMAGPPHPVTAPPRQHGGPVRAGQMYTVGEHGPEPFIPSTNGTILPNGSLGGTMNVEININGAGDPTAIARAVRDELLKFGRNNVGIMS